MGEEGKLERKAIEGEWRRKWSGGENGVGEEGARPHQCVEEAHWIVIKVLNSNEDLVWRRGRHPIKRDHLDQPRGGIDSWEIIHKPNTLEHSLIGGMVRFP